MSEDVKKEVIDIITESEKAKDQDKKSLEVTNVMVDLKQNLAGYLNSLIKSAVEEDVLFSSIKTLLLDKLPELNFDQLMRLYSTMDKKKSITNEQLTTLLKPTQQANSPLLDAFADVKKSEADDYEDAFDNMKSDDLRKIDKLDKIMSVFEKIADKIGENDESAGS